jgi:hypothetical protein
VRGDNDAVFAVDNDAVFAVDRESVFAVDNDAVFSVELDRFLDSLPLFVPGYFLLVAETTRKYSSTLGYVKCISSKSYLPGVIGAVSGVSGPFFIGVYLPGPPTKKRLITGGFLRERFADFDFLGEREGVRLRFLVGFAILLLLYILFSIFGFTIIVRPTNATTVMPAYTSAFMLLCRGMYRVWGAEPANIVT